VPRRALIAALAGGAVAMAIWLAVDPTPAPGLAVHLPERLFRGDVRPDLSYPLAAVGIGCIGGLLFLVRRATALLLVLPFLIGPALPTHMWFQLGDEPHYFVMADSIKHDGDLAVRDDYERGAVRAGLDPHLGGKGGVFASSDYSLHLPGTAIALLPGWLVGSRRLAMVPIALAAALAALEAIRLAEVFGNTRQRSTLAALAVVVAPAYLLFARQAYPEMLGALCIVHVIRRLAEWERDRRAGTESVTTRLQVAGVAAAAAAAPWLHFRFIIPVGLGVGVLALRSRAYRWVPPAAMGLALSLMAFEFNRWYGSPLPTAPYSGQHAFTGVQLRPLIGLLVDAHVGLLFVAPVAVVALGAARAVVPRLPLTSAVVGVSVGLALLSQARFFDWALGGCTPGRFWTSLLPLAVPLVAAALLRRPRLTAVAALVGAAATRFRPAFPQGAYPTFVFAPPSRQTLAFDWYTLGIHRAPAFMPPGATSTLVGVALVGLVAAVVGALMWSLREPAHMHVEHQADAGE
jgi:hypothetical protein